MVGAVVVMVVVLLLQLLPLIPVGGELFTGELIENGTAVGGMVVGYCYCCCYFCRGCYHCRGGGWWW